MKTNHVGTSGLRVTAVSIGGWLTLGGSVDAEASTRILAAAVDAGVNFIDMADVYARGEAERVVGRFLSAYESSGRERSDLVLSTKVFWPMSDGPNDRGLSRKHIFESIDRSLRRMATDYVDLYFCHRYDPSTPLEETVRAMDDLVRAGKVLYWGTSCWSADQLRAAHELCWKHGCHRPIAEQPQYNLVRRDIERDGVLDTARALGMGITAFSPLAQGFLTGKYDTGAPSGSRGATTRWVSGYVTDENVGRVQALSALADELGVRTGALAIAWLLHQEGVSTAITGASSVAQLEQNLRAASIDLPAEVIARIADIFGGR